jgi:hypothetical protein
MSASTPSFIHHQFVLDWLFDRQVVALALDLPGSILARADGVLSPAILSPALLRAQQGGSFIGSALAIPADRDRENLDDSDDLEPWA